MMKATQLLKIGNKGAAFCISPIRLFRIAPCVLTDRRSPVSIAKFESLDAPQAYVEPKGTGMVLARLETMDKEIPLTPGSPL
jgi:hypothetical protein